MLGKEYLERSKNTARQKFGGQCFYLIVFRSGAVFA